MTSEVMARAPSPRPMAAVFDTTMASSWRL